MDRAGKLSPNQAWATPKTVLTGLGEDLGLFSGLDTAKTML
jgi:hypothetical protein